MLFASVVAALCASFFALVFAASVGKQVALGERSEMIAALVLACAAMTLSAALWVFAGALLP